MARKKKLFKLSGLHLFIAAIGLVALSGMVTIYLSQTTKNSLNSRADTEQTITAQVGSSNGDVNEDGSTYQTTGDLWIGTAASKTASYTGLRFSGVSIPKGATITDAHVEVMSAKDQWISLSYSVSLATPGSSDGKPSQATLLPQSANHSSNEKWNANSWYSLENMTSVVQGLINRDDWTGSGNVMVVLKGSGSSYGRKYITSYDQNPGNAAKLFVRYRTGASSVTNTVTVTITNTQTITPTPTKIPVTTTPVVTNTNTSTPLPTNTPVSGTGGTSIFGAVSADLLGTCSQAVHDKYVVTGPDGQLYRTWHPAKDPSGCTFAHEHGDDPSTSKIYAGAVPFDYVAHVAGMDEPHAGFKCFVHNAGTKNDEGTIALHDSYYCFHMGTGGAARFTTRFHSLDLHVVTSKGSRMDIQGLADVGNVGTICDDPRQQRTVMGFGCKLDSAYEIWENRLNITNKGNVVATGITSTALFDSITVMDPADKTKAIPVWDPAAQTNIFKFVNDRTGYRGCDREAYTGPLYWYNSRGSQVYYTDVYGNVVDGGPLKQTISVVNTSGTGPIGPFGGLIMGYKSGNTNDPQYQFKYHKSACVSGLGVKN